MFIVWGKKAVYRHLGYVADFCPVCVARRAFMLERVGMAGHVYYITAGDGDLVGHQINCLECDVLLNGNPQRYASLAKTRGSVDALIQQTFPNYAEFHHERLLLEKQVRTNLSGLHPQNRRDLLLQPFTLFASKVAKHFEQTRFEFGRNYMRREILPAIAHALARLHPTESELSQLLQHLKQGRDIMGKKVRLDDLQAELALVYARAPAQGATVFGSADWGDTVGVQRGPGKRAGGALLGFEKAGRAIRIAGWIATVMALVGGVLPMLLDASAIKPGVAALVFALTGLSVASIFLGSAVERRASWARPAAIAYGVLMLLMFPFGTILGAYVLWQVIRGWGASEGSAPRYAT